MKRTVKMNKPCVEGDFGLFRHGMPIAAKAERREYVIMASGLIDMSEDFGDEHVIFKLDVTRKEGMRIYSKFSEGKNIKAQLDGVTVECMGYMPNYVSPIPDPLLKAVSDKPITRSELVTVIDDVYAPKEITRGRPSVGVAQYTEDGVLLKVWGSITEATESFGSKSYASISACLSGSRKHAFGYVWKRLE